MPSARRGSRGSLSKRRGSKVSLDVDAPTILSDAQNDVPDIPIIRTVDSAAAARDTVGALEPESKRVLESHGNATEGGDGEARPDPEIRVNSCERYVHENSAGGPSQVFVGGYVHVSHGTGALAVKSGIEEAPCRREHYPAWPYGASFVADPQP